MAQAHIVLPEGAEERIIIAADQVPARGIARLTLLGDESVIRDKAQVGGRHLRRRGGRPGDQCVA